MSDTTPQLERNKFIVDLISGGKKVKEVQEILVKSGQKFISINRIWKIWKKSSNYLPKRAKEQHCSFCLENKAQIEMKSISEKYKVVGKICNTCWDRLIPKQTANENEQGTN